ncbi:MAG TPA: helix-turn-helix transcriptional regulator [Promineifilum sp.]
MTDMASGTVRLKGRKLLERSGSSIYQLAKNAEVSYPAMHKYITDPGSVKQLSAEVLYGILTSLGLTIDEIDQIPLGEVFEFVPKGNGSATE